MRPRWTSTALLASTWLILTGACSRDVTIGRYPADATIDSSTGGRDGAFVDSGGGGSAGHDECAEVEPVCGTDHVTYMNTCLALRANVAVDYRGACR